MGEGRQTPWVRLKRAWADASRRRELERWKSAYRAWYEDDARLRDIAAKAKSFDGFQGDQVDTPLVVKRNERVFAVFANVGLVEPRAGARHWSGGYGGFSYRVTKNLRVNTGRTAGTSVAGPDELRQIDTGNVTVTSNRVVFQGLKQNREWSYAKLLGYQHDPVLPYTGIQVSNRQKVSGLLYDQPRAADFRFMIALAIDRSNGAVALAGQVEEELQHHADQRPSVPASAIAAGWVSDTGATLQEPDSPAGIDRAVASYRQLPTWGQLLIPLLVVVGVVAGISGGDESESSVETRRSPRVTTPSSELSSTLPPLTLPPTTLAPVTVPTVPPTVALPPPPSCDPNYDGCVPIASDVDCLGGSGDGPAYTGFVRVTGVDIYDLDSDNDGFGCE